MAARSITVARDAADIVASLTAYAEETAATVERVPLQNGERLLIHSQQGDVGLNVYPSKGGGCKVVFDRPDDPRADAITGLLQGMPSVVKGAKHVNGEIAPVVAGVECWVGSDESGKGDYFGPLVVAAVGLRREHTGVLVELGVQDSKNISDARARSLATQIRAAFPSEVVAILPRRYNELWLKLGSVNRLLAWGHARAIENVLERAPEATHAVADQFGDESLIRNALFEHGRAVTLVQMPRAERDPAVAAASILARAEFLNRLDQLSRTAGVALPKGASAAVEAVGRALVASRGAAVLSEIAKTHFKTTQRVLQGQQ